MKTCNSPRIGSRLWPVILVTMFAVTVQAQTAYESTVLADNPVGFWPLSLYDTNATNGIATDLSGNGNTGSYKNIYPGFNNVPGPSPYMTNGISFDGQTTYVDLSTGGHTGLLNFGGPITMEAWVQSTNDNGYIIGKGYDANQNSDEIEMRLMSGGAVHGGTYNSTTGDKGVTGGNIGTNWSYAAVTWDGTNWNLYFDGALISTSPDTVGAIDFVDPWAIGDGTVSGYSRLFTGNLSHVALYNNALTPRQVLNHYFLGNYGTTNLPPFIASQPASLTAGAGATVTFTCQPESLLPTTNQWYFNGNPVPGQTNATLVLSDIQTDNGGSYSVIIGNSAGSTNSAAATLTVAGPQYINWQTPEEVSGASDVATNGTYFASWAPYDGGANSLPVNGVSFQGFTDLPDFSNNFPGGNGGPYFNSPATADANYNSLLEYATWANGPGAQFSWGGMTPGHTYLVQLWVEDCRNGATDARWENFSGGDGALENAAYGTDTSAPLGYSALLFSPSAGSPGYYIIGTFVADSSGSEEILLTAWDVNANNQSAQINLFQVRDITSAAPAQPEITGISLAGPNLIINGTNGTSGVQFTVLTTTNLTLPLSQWTPIATNTFSGSGFSVTNAADVGSSQQFYTIKVP